MYDSSARAHKHGLPHAVLFLPNAHPFHRYAWFCIHSAEHCPELLSHRRYGEIPCRNQEASAAGIPIFHRVLTDSCTHLPHDLKKPFRIMLQGNVEFFLSSLLQGCIVLHCNRSSRTRAPSLREIADAERGALSNSPISPKNWPADNSAN